MRAKLVAWGVGLALTFVALTAAQAQTWIEVKPEGGAYRVMVPGEVKFSQQAVALAGGGSVQMHQALYETADMALLSTHVDYPDDVIRGQSPEQLLMNVRDGSAKGNKLRSDRALTVSGHPGREYVIVMANDLVSVTRSALVGTRLYQIIAVVAAGSESNPAIRRFIDSFEVLLR